MGSPDLFKAVTRTLEDESVQAVAQSDIHLTPYLSIVVAILYMMASDGDISDSESSQLQSVVGNDVTTLHRAVAYAEKYSVERFLQEAPPLLDAKARHCLLINVCDSLMSDGEMSETELQLFDRLLSALGQTREKFQPHFDTIATKGKTSVFGDFNAAASMASLTPPMALVVSLLYMMASDGEMAEEEIGRLNVVVGGSQALLKVGLRYVNQVRAPQFLASAAGMLDERQRLCILLNVCDTMMSDREVAAAERDLFRRMLTAFAVSEKDFERHLNLIYLKNNVPEDVKSPSVAAKQAIPAASGASQSEGLIFERKQTWEEETGKAGKAGAKGRRDANAGSSQKGSQSELDTRISRTMQDNIDRMSHEFDEGLALDALERNSRSDGPEPNARSAVDGASDLRKIQDADAGAARDTAAGAGEGPASLRTLRDADADSGMSNAAAAGKGPADLRTLRDADSAAGTGKAAAADEGPADPRAYRDAEGQASSENAADKASHTGPHWQDAAGSGEQRALKDADGPPSARLMTDNSDAFGATPDEAGDGPLLINAIGRRMHTVRDRTRMIYGYLKAMQSAKSIIAASRLPALPAAPLASRPASMVVISSSNQPSQVAAEKTATEKTAVEKTAADGEPNHSSGMLLMSDEGGPIMSASQSAAPASGEEAKLHRSLRRSSAVLLPALFLTYGATMVGETLSEHTFVTNENMATDARIVHQWPVCSRPSIGSRLNR